MENRSEYAADLFMQGYNCGQAVGIAFADRYNISTSMMSRICSAFGGGIGKQRLTCGAVLALTVLAGLEEGNESLADKENMEKSFMAIKLMSEQFKQQYGSLVCGEIMGFKGFEKAEGIAQKQPVPEQYKAKPCALKVALAVNIFEEYLKKKTTK